MLRTVGFVALLLWFSACGGAARPNAEEPRAAAPAAKPTATKKGPEPRSEVVALEQSSSDSWLAAPDIDRHNLARLDETKTTACMERHALATLAAADDAELFAAADCFDGAGNVGFAVRIFHQLLLKHPTSAHGAAATLRIALLHEEAQWLRSQGKSDASAEAARYFRIYAQKYAAEADAPQALARAICIARELGLEEDVVKGLEFFEKQYRKTFDMQALCRKG